MARSIPLGWLQLKHQKLRLLAATLGITFAVVLVFVQMEFREALFDSAIRYHKAFDYDLVMLSPKSAFLIGARQFPRSRLYQSLGLADVDSVTPLYSAFASLRHPLDPTSARNIFVVGFNPADPGLGSLVDSAQHEQIKRPYTVIFDRLSRPEYGPIAALVAEHGSIATEINNSTFTVSGLYSVGTSFGVDGGIVTSDLNFLRMFPGRNKSAVDVGLISLKPGVDTANARQRIIDTLPNDVVVLDRNDFEQLEIDYWNTTTPIGYIFTFGVIMGLIVGAIIVYQILFSDVQDHLAEYATLKAMGYTHGYLRAVVLQEAVILAVIGYVPGMAISWVFFDRAAAVTQLPLNMTLESAGLVLALTLAICVGSGMIALRKLRSADPAEVF